MHTPPFDDQFWLDASVDKSAIPGLTAALMERALSDSPMSAFSLKYCQLAGIDLVRRGSNSGYDLSRSDFYRANLKDAHLFAVNLRESSLMKADLRGANLHCADLREANLLGVKLEGARLDNVLWGDVILQERLALHERHGEPQQQLDLLQQAEEIYRNLRLTLESAGLFEQAGVFFRREMIMRRLQMPLWSSQRSISWMVDLFCGYGEQPLRVVLFSLGFILFCAALYFMVGVEDGDLIIKFSSSQDSLSNLQEFISCIYYSVVTFTTLGYGDLVPQGVARLIAAFEAFAGSFTMALFVVVFVKKMTR